MRQLSYFLALGATALLGFGCADGLDEVGSTQAEAKGAGTSGKDACNEVDADRTGNMGLSAGSVTFASTGLDYASAGRVCKRFVSDIGISYQHQLPTPITAFATDGGSTLSADMCPSWLVNGSVYERLDKQNLNTGKWTVGQRTKVSDFTFVGVWDADAMRCTLQLFDGSVPSFLPPSGAGEQRVIRVAGAATVNGTGITLPVLEGLTH